jgi:uncharacterized membrane protein (Fun14 family)
MILSYKKCWKWMKAKCLILYFISLFNSHGHGMVVGFITTYAISAYHQ